MVQRLEYRRPWLYPKQEAAIFDALDHRGVPARYALIEASTKAGKTSACIAWLAEQAVQGGEGQGFWWIAPVYSQAKIAYRRMKKGLPKWLFTPNESELRIVLVTGAVIQFKSAEKPDNLYGDDVYAAVIDEASRVREEAWHAIRSTLTATQGPCRMIGNVKGRRNWFFKMARQAEAGADNMSYARMNAWDAVAGGVLEQAEIEDAQRLLPENVFRELYLAEASDDEGNPFGYAHIAACVGELSEERTAVFGCDLAKSVDWTVVIGLDRHGCMTGMDRWQRVPWAATTRRITGLIRGTPAYVDSTGVGDPIVEALQVKCPAAYGVKFTSATKQQLMEGLALAIQEHEVVIADPVLRAELEIFEYVYTRTGVRYSAPAGYHDDTVIALALAVARLREVEPKGMNVGHASVDRISPWLGNQTA